MSGILSIISLIISTAHITHQCGKTAVLSCHRCLINTSVKKRTTFKFRLELLPQDVSKSVSIQTIVYNI